MSGKRFGGQYSPGGNPNPDGNAGVSTKPVANQFSGRKASAVDVRAILMFVLPTPLLFAAFGAMSGGSATKLVILLAAYGCLMLGAWLLREGQRAAQAYDERTIARAPAFPRKICAAGLAGIGIFLGVMSSASPDGILSATGALLQAAVFGVVGTGAHLLAFGLDPMKAKGGTGAIHEAELARVTDALDKAEDKLKTIEQLAGGLRDREISDKVGRLNATVRDMIKIVEQDPRDLSRARRYLGVYLKGAKDATQKYADNHARLNDPKLREDYLGMLSDLEESFNRGKETLLLDDRADLEVEIEVLRDRLGQEST